MVSATLLAISLAGQLQAQAAQLPAAQPPADSPPVVRVIEIAFPAQGNVSVIEPATYLYYIETRPSRPSVGAWVTYDPQTVLDDFHRLWNTNFLDDLAVDVRDEPYENGVIGKHVTFVLEERPRVKIMDYEGADELGATKIDETLKEAGASIRIDSFLDPGLINRCKRVITGMLLEKGYQFAKVTHTLKTVGGGPKVVHLTFNLETGPRVRIRKVSFAGNKAFGNRSLSRRMKANKAPQGWLPSFVRRRGYYQPTKFEEDADHVVQFCRDRGYVAARVGAAEIEPLADSKDRKTRWVELRVPIEEGKRYRVGSFTIDGNTVVKEQSLRQLFRVQPGAYYRENVIRKGFEKAREVYGSVGYFEFTGYPDLKPKDEDGAGSGTEAAAAEPAAEDSKDSRAAEDPKAPKESKGRDGVLDVTLRLQEGPRYFVNRITFKGNSVTRDSVIRREMAIYEGGVFNTEALKYSVKRLNQLGYFKPVEGEKGISVEKPPGTENRVDVTLNVEEQNRNQIQFGAGVSQWDGVYGALGYTAANFLGRGESVNVSLQKGSRSNLYLIGVTEPYMFDRPISAGVELYSRKNNYLLATGKVGYSEVREGSSWSVGKPIKGFSRVNANYTYEITHIAVSSDLMGSGSKSDDSESAEAGMPWFSSYYDIGRHVDSRITPTFIVNTVDNPMVPHSGMRVSGSLQTASTWLRGSYNYLKPELEWVLYLPTSRKTGFGLRAGGGWLHRYWDTASLPYYLRYFLGGEYQIRGVDIRTVGPMDSNFRALGGNKYLLFNAEYYLDIAGPVRALLFHDAGQAFSESQRIDLRQLRTSSGAELRVTVPMLNVPFRLIWAWNAYRDTFQPKFAFKFAVGTTF